MKAYFYHTQDIQRIFREWQQGIFPCHLLYGANLLDRYGIDVIQHHFYVTSSRLKLIFFNSIRFLSCTKHYDAVYATHYQGIEIIIFLRALGLFRKPIIAWIHQPITTNGSWIKKAVQKLFFKGIDHMIFFSEKMRSDAVHTPFAHIHKTSVVHWGPDLDFYDRIMKDFDMSKRSGFISSGKELRDMPRLIEAFNITGKPLDIFYPKTYYTADLAPLKPNSNIKITLVDGLRTCELAKEANKHFCNLSYCKPTNYTTGLTSVVEAMALGQPIVGSRNPSMPFDYTNDGFGISVNYEDTTDLVDAINYIDNNREEAIKMGKTGRKLAEKKFNINLCAQNAAQIIKKVVAECNREC